MLYIQSRKLCTQLHIRNSHTQNRTSEFIQRTASESVHAPGGIKLPARCTWLKPI